ncbi:MAG: ABC transporter substrate-binding protein [Burkholderiales bacterium]
MSLTNNPDTLWYTRCPVPTASGIAIHHGWLDAEFAPDGIAIRSLRASADRAVRESHFDHRQPDSFRQGGNAPPIWARSDGQDTVVVGLVWLPQYQSILSLPDTGLRTAADLKGARLALPRRVNEKIDFWRASALQGYAQTLASVGLTLDDVTLVDLPIDEPYIRDVAQSDSGPLFDARQFARSVRAEAFALIRGEVDALYNYGASGPALQEFLGAQTVVDIAHHPDQRVAINNGTPTVLTVSGRLVREQPDLVARYLLQVLRAARWAHQHPTEAAPLVAQEVSVATEWVGAAFDDSLYEALFPSLAPPLVDALKVRKEFLLRHGFLRRDFSVDEWIDPHPLQRALEWLDTPASMKPY